MIKAFLFDLDGTLLDRDATVEKYLKTQYQRHNLKPLPFNTYRDRFVELDEHGYADKEKVFGSLIEEFGIAASVEELVTDFKQNAWRNCQLFSDAIRVLSELRLRGYLLGIISNGSVESQQAKISSAGLDVLVDEVLISAIENVKKPEKEIYIRAAQRLGVDTNECVYAGDNPQADVVGAANAGMKTVWLYRYAAWPDGLTVAPDYIVSELSELLDIGLINR